MSNGPKSIPISQLSRVVKRVVEEARRANPEINPEISPELRLMYWPHVICGVPVDLPLPTKAEAAFGIASQLAKQAATIPGVEGEVEPAILSQGKQTFVGFTIGEATLSS
jgi:hypothetical protein